MLEIKDWHEMPPERMAELKSKLVANYHDARKNEAEQGATAVVEPESEGEEEADAEEKSLEEAIEEVFTDSDQTKLDEIIRNQAYTFRGRTVFLSGGAAFFSDLKSDRKIFEKILRKTFDPTVDRAQIKEKATDFIMSGNHTVYLSYPITNPPVFMHLMAGKQCTPSVVTARVQTRLINNPEPHCDMSQDTPPLNETIQDNSSPQLQQLDYIPLNDVTYEDPFSVGSAIPSKVQNHVKTESEKLASCSMNLSSRGIANKLSDEVDQDDTKAEVTDSAVLADQDMVEADHDGLTDDRDLVEDESKPTADVSSIAPVTVFTKENGLEDVAMDDVNDGGCEAPRINAPEASDQVKCGDAVNEAKELSSNEGNGVVTVEKPLDVAYEEPDEHECNSDSCQTAPEEGDHDDIHKDSGDDGVAPVSFDSAMIIEQDRKKGQDTVIAEKFQAAFSREQDGGALGGQGGEKVANRTDLETAALMTMFDY